MIRCSICDENCTPIRGDGPEPCDVMCIGEKPGREEAARKWVFVGDTGKELNATYLPLAGLERSEVRISNALKCRLGNNNNKPTEEQVKHCAGAWLPGEIERCSPELIVLMGSTACSLVPKIRLDYDHGLPVFVNPEDSELLGGWSGWVFPVFHPAAGLHDTGQMIPMLDDWARLGKWRRGKWTAPVDEHPDVHYTELKTEKAVWNSLKDEFYKWLPVDTENDGPRPWSVQYSTRPGTSWFIPAERKDLISVFSDASRWGHQGLWLHNATHDLDVLERMGVRPYQFRDTMQEAYQLCNLPQGLKALAWRLLGVRMRSWEDVVKPASRDAMVEWLMKAWDVCSEELRVTTEKQLKTKVKVEIKPSKSERDVRRLLTHSPKPDYELWEKVKEAELDPRIVERIGPPPIISIVHATREEAIRYSAGDADMTGRVGLKLQEMREQRVEKDWAVDEGDWDK